MDTIKWKNHNLETLIMLKETGILEVLSKKSYMMPEEEPLSLKLLLEILTITSKTLKISSLLKVCILDNTCIVVKKLD
jgi:hypothetical protein